VTGPESLTYADITGRLSAALGRQVAHVTLRPAELAAALRARGVPAQFADDVAELGRQVAAGSFAATTSAVRDLTGRPPRTFDQFIGANLQALQAAFASTQSRITP
jgi:NAD(P)H dehydrogenase (quinone)